MILFVFIIITILIPNLMIEIFVVIAATLYRRNTLAPKEHKVILAHTHICNVLLLTVNLGRVGVLASSGARRGFTNPYRISQCTVATCEFVVAFINNDYGRNTT